MHRLSTSFVLGYHGCPENVAERLLKGEPFVPSTNTYDWLGPGIYFWQSNPRRALGFAREKARRDSQRWRPAVVGAVIELGFCLDLATDSGISAVVGAHAVLAEVLTRSGAEIPTNGGGRDLLLRRLDCAVIRTLHDIRADNDLEPYDSVIDVFVEGEPVYPGAGISSKTHIQICVRRPEIIKGVFRVSSSHL